MKINKRLFKAPALLLLATVFLVIPPHVEMSSEESLEEKPSVKILDISGSVTLLSSDKAIWEYASSGMTLYSGDGIKTRDNSAAKLAFNAEKTNIVKIHPNSYVVLKLKKDEKIELIDGSIFSSLKKLPPGSEFKIRTPLATCGARGTKFTVLSKKAKSLTRVSVLENSVILQSIKEPHKSAAVKELQQRDLSPWKKVILSAKGTGFPSEKRSESLPLKKVSPGGRKQINEDEYINAFGAASVVNAKRAAVTDAHRNLAAKIYGIVIDSKTTLEDNARKNNKVRVTVKGIVRGAVETSTIYYSDGSVIVTMETEGTRLKKSLIPITGDIFGVDCLSGAVTIDSSEFEDSLL